MGKSTSISLSICVLIVLSVLWKPAYSENKCATGCRGSSGSPAYLTGHKYSYSVDGDVSVYLTGADQQETGVKLSAQVTVSALGNCAHVLRVQNLIITGPGGKKYGKPPGIEKPVRFTLEDGALGAEICAEDGDTRRSLNIKRAIISLLQNEHKQASEVDVFGVCPTQSSSSQEGPARLVHRSRDLGRCAHREQGGQALVAAVYNPNAEIKDSQVLQSTLYVESKVTNGVPEKVSATEEYLYKPFSVGQNGARAKVNTRLSLVGKTGGSDNGRFMDVRSIIFENPHGEKSEQSNMNNALKAVKDTAKLVADQASYQSAGAFAQLIRILRVTNMNDLLSVYGQVKGNSLLRRVFLDGLLRAGTAASIEASVQLVKSGEMSQLEQSLVYLSLANAKHVDNDAVTAAATLLDTPNIPKEVYLGVGALAGAYCREHKCHARGSQSDGIATLSQKLVSKLNCRPTSKVEEDYTVAILKGIRNIRHIEDCLIGKLVQCVRDDSVKARVKVAALEAYQADPCSTQLKDTAIEAMKNRELDSEVRIKAYLTVILCPCGRCANEIKNLLDDEPSIQVGRYISTSLRHIKASANPDMQLAREHFSQIRIPTKYSVDDRKYSFYREFSYNVDALGTGGVLEQSVIYSQESFLPRSISLNLTAEVFGHSVNVFEIGGRQGNLDRVMEHFLGPKGYVRQNSPQEIYEDIVHRYEEVHKKVQGKFRGRRSLQQDIKNFDKQIKDEGEPYNNELDLDIYVKLFGTDAVFLSLGDNKGFNFNSVLDSMLKYVENGCNSMKHFQEEIRAHILFLDAELAYPTSLGLPLKLNLIGSATARLEAATKIDVKQIMRDPANAKIDIKLNPSTDIQISGQLVIDADQVMTGLKVSANLHSATGGHLLVQTVENGQGFDLQYVLPEKKLEIVTASNDLVYVTAEKGYPETTVALKVDTDRKEYYGCFDQLSSLFGLTLCGEISVPFSVSGPEAQVSIQKYLARYPLTGSSMIKAHLEQNDLRGYHVKGVLRRENRMRQSFELLFETQGSQTRKTALTGELVNSPEEKTIKLGLESPIKNLYGQATLYTKRSEVTAMVLAKLDAEKYYGRIGFNVQGNEQRSVYKPFIEYEMPGTQGTKSMNVRGQVIRQSSGPTTIFTLDGIRIDIDQRESIDMKGKATFVRNGFECDLEVNKGPQNMAVRLSAKDHDLNVRFTNTLNPYVNFDLKVHSENRDKYYQNDVDLCYGDNLDARRQTVIVKQLLKYQETDSGKYNVHTRNELSVNHIPLSAKFYAEIDSKKVDVELEGKFGTNKAEFDLEARTHIKAPGDYSIKIDAEVDDKGVELVAKRDIVNADQSNFENVFVIKNMVKYELSGVVTHRNKPDDVNFGTVGHLKVSGGGKTEDLKFDIGLQNNPSTYMSHAEITKGTVKFLYYSLKVVRGANPNGELKFELKNTVNCHGNYKVTDADGSGSGIIIVDFVKLPRKLKGDIRFKVKAPIYSVDGDLYLNYEKDNNDKIHFSTNTKSSDATFDSKNKLDYDGKCTELNIFVDGATNVANGKFKGQVQVVLPSERTLELGLARDAATQNDVVNGNAELVLSDAPKRGATPSKFVYKGKIIDTSYKTNSFNYEGQILISLKDGRSLQNSFFLKNIPQGNDKFKFDFKSEVNGNLIPKPASITASNEYTHSGKMLINDNNKYRVKGSYGGDCTFDLDFKDETQLDAGDKKYYLYFDLVTNLPFEKVHYIKIKSDELYLYSENKDVGFEYNLKEMVQINADEYRVDASGKIGKSEGTSKLKYLAPHAEPFYLETSYKANLKGDDKSGAVAIKSNYGRGKSASINVEGAKTSTQEYTLHINANAPQAERLKKLDVSFNSKRPNHDTYNSNLIVDADGKVYKGDYLIVFSKANPVLEIKVNYPESKKTSRVYMKGNNMSSNQGKVELKLENIKDLSMDLNAEGIIQKDNIAFKVHANSEKLGLKNYYTEIVSKDTGSGKRLEFNAKNNNVNLLSGSTSFISKQEGSKTIIEGSGTVRLKEEQKSATFKYIRDTLTEGHEQGVETFMNVAVGERSYVAESRVTNLEYKYSYVYCEEKKQCAHAELNSKINTPSAGVFQHNVNVVLDLRKLGFAPEFGLQMLSEVSDRKLPQYTLDVYLNKENKKYHLRVYSTPKDNQLPAGITITLPHREIALESVVNYRGDKALPFPIKGEICLYMDKNKPHQKTSIRGLLDVTGSANEKTATAEIGFSHPRLGREAVLKFGGYLRQSSADNFKIEGVSSFSHPHFGHERSSKFLMEVSPRTFKLMMDTPLVKCIEVDAEGTVNDDLQEGKLKFSIMQGKPVQVYAVARGYKYYEFTTSYSEDTQRKLSIVGTIDPEKRVDLTADIVLPGEKKNIAHGAFYLQDNLVKSDYGGSKDNFDYFVAALMKDLDNLKERVSQLGSKASEEYRRTVEKAGQLANQLQNSYKTEMEHIKRELADDKTFQEIDKLLKSVIQYIGTLVVEVYEVADKLVTQINNAMQENAKKISELYETQLAPQINQLYENISAILKEYMEGLLDLVAHFTALVSNFIDKHKAELQELTNTFTEIFKDLTRLLVTHLKELRKTVTEALVNITQQIKDLPIIQTIKDKFEELGVMEQVLTLMKSIHEKIYTILPNAETKQFAGAMYEYVQKKLRQVKVDDAAELRVIFEKLAAAVTSLLQGARQKLGEIGMPSLYGLAMPQLTDFFGNFGSTPSFEGSSSFSLINQALSGELPSALDLIKAYRPRYINPLDEVPNKLRAVVVNGQHIFTFDGRHLTFPGSCRYVLAHDYVDQNFTLLIQLQNGLPKALVLEDKTGSVVELKENGQVALNGVNHGFPVMEKDLFAFRETNGRIGLGTSYGLIARCTSRLTVCYIEVSGYYFNKLRGLLGDGNNEPYTDFKLPSGRVATSEAEFGNSYRLAASCPQVRTPDHSHHLSSLPAACEQVFSGQSPLRPLSLLLDVDPFKQACTHACTANPGKALQEACDLARGYAALAVTGLLPAVVPPACVQCNDADKPRKLGEEYTLELPAKQADIIVAVETTMETERIFKNIAVPVLSQVVDSLKSKRINDIKVHLVGITSKMPYPIVYDTDQKLKTAKVKFEDPSRYSYPKFLREHKRQRRYAQQAAEAPRPAFDVIEFLSHLGIDNVIAGYMSLLEIPVRAGAVKTTISVVGEKCRKRSFLADVILGVATVPMFKAQDHTQNIIAPVGDLKFDGRESTVIAYDSHSVLVYGDKTRGKDTQELRRKLFNPPDSCTDYTELNDGLVISATNFERNAAQQKEFVQAAGLAIVDRMLSQRRTQSCICAYADPFSARSFCVPTSVKQVAPRGKQRRRK